MNLLISPPWRKTASVTISKYWFRSRIISLIESFSPRPVEPRRSQKRIVTSRCSARRVESGDLRTCRTTSGLT